MFILFLICCVKLKCLLHATPCNWLDTYLVMAYNEGNVNFCNHKFYGMLITVRDLFMVQAGTSFEANVYGILYTRKGSGRPFSSYLSFNLRIIYLVAENSVVKINLFTGTFEPAAQVILSFQPDKDGNGRGLFAFSVHGQLIWSAGPVLKQFGYPQGCRKNATDCYFTSVPVIDQCKASIYISSTEGELYSLSIPTPHFRWIQDLSSFDKEFTVTPGNNGRLYVVVPVKALLLALDASAGNVLWQGSIGPLSSLDSAPVVDSNGWVSLGSLDGFLYSFSPDGVLKKFSKAIASDSAIQVGPVLDCSGYAVYISQTEMEGKSSRVVGYYTYTSSLKPNQIKYNTYTYDKKSNNVSDVNPPLPSSTGNFDLIGTSDTCMSIEPYLRNSYGHHRVHQSRWNVVLFQLFILRLKLRFQVVEEEPSPSCIIFRISNSNSKGENLLISVMAQHCKQNPSVLTLKVSSINTDHWSTIRESLYGSSEGNEQVLELVSVGHLQINNRTRVGLQQHMQVAWQQII
ncbi:hypothetical protein UlMin_007061 [Ulmus minor]